MVQKLGQAKVMLGEHNRYVQQAGSVQDQFNESTSYARALQTRLAELQRMKKTNEDTQVSAAESGSGGTAILTRYDEEIKAVQQLMKWQGQEQQNIQKTIDLQKQEAATQTARDQHEQGVADHSASEAANKAAEARLKAMEATVNQWKTNAPVTAKAINDYWELQKSTFSSKSSEFNSIVAKQADLAEAGARAAHEQMQKLRQSLKQDSTGTPAGIDRNVDFLGNTAESARSLNRAGLTNALGDAEAQATIDKTRISIELASGSISKLTADQRLAAIEAELHAKRLADLNTQLHDLQQNSGTYNSVTGMFGSDRDQQQANSLQSQMVKEQASATVDAMKSAADIAGQSWQTALTNANAMWVQNAQDTAAQVVSIYHQAIDGLNDNLSNLIVGKRANFAGMFQGLGKSLGNDALQQGESSLLGKFGISAGKPDGSASKPFNVRIVGSMTGAASGLGSLFSQSSSSSTTQSALGGIGGFIAHLFGGGRAIGGGVSSGTTYLVGEAGPELFSPGTSGTIIPNHALSGGNAYYNVQVANGVTPEQMNMHMQTVLQQYHGTVMKDSVAANKNHAQRRPSMAR
ncbi:phage tail tape measure C-terminal domain-containing protein [Granulicella paludicola]|uniref:phage tail tape measure C-terminal domain-containing protein n=1 Tax=Granulicella paludicola TaxID=474951 RepID=UPI0021DFDA03|nr:phage tail tape measure C-terminal domain-containing protein [Granulicella paludicola]